MAHSLSHATKHPRLLTFDDNSFKTDSSLLSHWSCFAAGMARFVCHDPQNVFDCIPCDVVASVVLLSAAALHAVNPFTCSCFQYLPGGAHARGL